MIVKSLTKDLKTGIVLLKILEDIKPGVNLMILSKSYIYIIGSRLEKNR